MSVRLARGGGRVVGNASDVEQQLGPGRCLSNLWVATAAATYTKLWR